MLRLRPQTDVNKTSFQANSTDEGGVFIISIVTEGSKEEEAYLRGAQDYLTKRKSQKVIIQFINNDIVDKEKETRASHPMRRLELMIERVEKTNPYYKDYPDEFWLVCDRDDGSFSAEQYIEVLKICEAYKIKLVISNPAFQLWLLFHFDSWLREGIFEDGLRQSEILGLIEKRLKKCLRNKGGYKHGTLVFSPFGSRIESAISNSKRYCTDIEKLKTELGTNFSELIESIKKNCEE